MGVDHNTSGVTIAIWCKWAWDISCYFLLATTKFVIHPRSKVPMQKDLERVFPTYASGNRQKDSSTGCDTYRILWIVPAPLSCSPGAPTALTWAVTYGVENFCGSPDFQRRSSSTLLEHKLHEFECIGVGERKAWFCQHHSSSKGAQCKAERRPASARDFPHRDRELVSGCGASPGLQDASKELISLSQHPECWIGSSVSGEREQICQRRLVESMLKRQGSSWLPSVLYQEACHKRWRKPFLQIPPYWHVGNNSDPLSNPNLLPSVASSK